MVATSMSSDANHIRHNALACSFEPINEILFYLSSQCVLMIRMQNVFGKAIIMYQIPILVSVIYDMTLRPTLRVLAPINGIKEVLIHIRYSIVHRYQKCA